MPLTDRQRVELGVPAAIAWALCRQIIKQSTLSEAGLRTGNALMADLHIASNEPLGGLHARDRDKIRLRLDRTAGRMLDGLEESDCRLVDGLRALHEALRILIDTGALEIVAGGAFDRGWTNLGAWIFDPSMDDGQGQKNEIVFDQAEARGRKMGHLLVALFQQEGLYRQALDGLTFAGGAKQ